MLEGEKLIRSESEGEHREAMIRVFATLEPRDLTEPEQVIKAALYEALQDASEVERIFLIIKAQSEY